MGISRSPRLTRLRVRVADELRQDVRYALRILRRSPTFTVVATLTLALGVGANAAMFSVIDAVALKPLPFRESNRLVRVFATKAGAVVGGPSALDARDVAQMGHTFESLAVYDEWRKNVAGLGPESQPEQMIVGLVPRQYFEILGIAPVVGRLFESSESQYGNHYVAAISRRLWRDRFGSARDILGRSIRINDEPYTIVAVMPDTIPLWMENRATGIMIWTPFAPTPDVWSEARRNERDFFAIGRLRPNVSIDQARTEVSELAANLARTYDADREYGMTVAPLADSRGGPLRDILVILAGAVALVLVCACANLANLIVARNAGRQRELTVRTALGAERARLARQLVVETLVLALLGGVVGFGAAAFACAALGRWHPAALPQLSGLGVNGTVFAFAAVVSLVAGLSFGLGPALMTSRVDLAARLRDGGRTMSGGMFGASRRLKATLVIVQVAVSLTLVASAALLARSASRLSHQDFGIRVDHALHAHVYLPPVRYTDAQSLTRFADAFGDAVRAIPGVESATMMTGYPPVNQRWVQPIRIPANPPPRAGETQTAFLGIGDERYLEALGIPLLRGRDLSPGDLATSMPVVLVNEAFERAYFSASSAVGREIRIGPDTGARPRTLTIVGVFRDTKNNGLRAPTTPQVVGLYRQLPEFNIAFKDIVVRTRGEPLAAIPAMRRELAKLDPNMPLAEAGTIDEVIANATGSLAFTTWMLAAFAVLGVVLAAIGTYGVIAYQVGQQTAEIGIRIAIGASPTRIVWMVVRRGVYLATVGILAGLGGSVAVSRIIGRETYGISALDPATLAATAVLMFLIALTASAIPAVRAARIDPLRALSAQ